MLTMMGQTTKCPYGQSRPLGLEKYTMGKEPMEVLLGGIRTDMGDVGDIGVPTPPADSDNSSDTSTPNAGTPITLVAGN